MLATAYSRYLLVGAIVGVMAIIAREALALILPGDTPAYYLLSVLIIYGGGIIASFYGHFHISFAHVEARQHTLIAMLKFTLVALTGMAVTVWLSWLIRYNIGLYTLFGVMLPSISFGIAALLASLLTYSLNASFIFVDNDAVRKQPRSTTISQGTRPEETPE
jgi:putative flippase GtrA